LVDIIPSLVKGGAEQGFVALRRLSTINKLPAPRSVWRKLLPNYNASKPVDDRPPAPPAGKDCHRQQVGSRSFQGESFGCLIPAGDELAIVGVMEAVNAQSAAANFWRKRSSVLERNFLMQRLSNPGSPDEGGRE
jgi:hypothetical protein